MIHGCGFVTNRFLSLVVANENWAYSHRGTWHTILCLIKWSSWLLTNQCHFRVMARPGRCCYFNSLCVRWTHIERYLDDVLIMVMNMHRWYFLPLHLLLLLLLLGVGPILNIIAAVNSHVVLSHIEDLGLCLASHGGSHTVLVEDLFVSLLMILNLVRNLRQINYFLSLISCWAWLATRRCRDITMMQLIVWILAIHGWNLVFTYPHIGEFRYWNDFLLAKCPHLVCRLRHSSALTLTSCTIIVELEVLLEHTAVFAGSLYMNLRGILVSRSGSAWWMKAVQALRPRLVKIDHHIWCAARRHSNILLIVLLRCSWALDFLHDLNEVLLRQMIWSARAWACIRIVIALLLATTSISTATRRYIQSIIALLYLCQFRWWNSRWNTWLWILQPSTCVVDYSVVSISNIHWHLGRMRWLVSCWILCWLLLKYSDSLCKLRKLTTWLLINDLLMVDLIGR
jgi:hypothetical protein